MANKNGHYCKICGFYKSNESFSGSGHSAHICKKCAALSPVERSAEMTVTKIMNLPWRLSPEQKSWLKALRNDRRPEIAGTAREFYRDRFPFAERNERKKQLRIQEMSLTIHDELMDEYGSCFTANISFRLNRKQRTILYNHNGATDAAELEEKDMKLLLKRIVHDYEIFCWDEDYSCPESDSELLVYEEKTVPESAHIEYESAPMEPCESPAWMASIVYLNGETQAMRGDYIAESINDLALELLRYFEDLEDLAEDEPGCSRERDIEANRRDLL